MKVTCKCGVEFITYNSRIKVGKGKYCSLKCKRENMTRRSGLTYNIKTINKGWFKKGHEPWSQGEHLSQETKNKLSVAHKGKHYSPATEFCSDATTGAKNINWKGNDVGYFSLHAWLTRNYGKPKSCEKCGSKKKVQWASKNYSYGRDRDDWFHLCYYCHRQYDSINGWGIASQIFNLRTGVRNV